MASSLAQRRALALVPKFTGWISFGFSGLVTAAVLRDKTRRSLCYHRLICGISLVDMSASLWLGLSTWPIPRSSGALWAIGNATSCNIQGFFTQFGISSSFYNASLAIYFYLVVVQGWNEQRLQRIEWMLHTIPLLWALVSAVTGLFLGVFDNATLWCWVSAEKVSFRWIAFYGPLWLNILIVTCSCLAIFLHVRKLELRSQKYRPYSHQSSMQQRQHQGAGETSAENGKRTAEDYVSTQTPLRTSSRDYHRADRANQQNTGGQNNNKSIGRSNSIYHQSRRVKDVADQCFLYAGAFYINWAALTATRLIQTINGQVYYPLVLIAAITVPMQGLPNFVVYLRPKLRRVRKHYPNAGWIQWVARSMSRNESRHVAGEAARLQRISAMDGMNPSHINDDLDDDDAYDVDGNRFDVVDAEAAVAANTQTGDDNPDKVAQEKEKEQTLDNPPVVQD